MSTPPKTMAQRQTMAELFDRVAGTYDQVGVELFKPIADRLVAELAPRPGERALDVGCGRGLVLVNLAQAVAPSGRAWGIDISPRMVEAAREEAAIAGVAADVRLGDAQAPELEPGVYDLVASSLVLFFLPDPLAALRAWRALLVEGGRAGVTTFDDFSPQWRAVNEIFEPYRPATMRDARPTGRGGPFASDAGMERLFADAGFREVGTASMNVPVRFVDDEHWYRWTWSVDRRAMWEAIPEQQRDAVRARAYEALGGCRFGDGRIGFDQEVRLTLGRR